jgi:hypothetical protein
MEDLSKILEKSANILIMRQITDDLNDKLIRTTDLVDLYNFDMKKIEYTYENEYFNVYAYDIENMFEHVSFDMDVKYGFESYNFHCFYRHDETIFFGKSLFDKFKIDIQEEHINSFLALILEMIADNLPADFWIVRRNQN